MQPEVDPLFFELHTGLLREAPGGTEETLKALALTGLGGAVRVLDIGCGPGAAVVAILGALPEAKAVAVDLHAPFLAEAALRAEKAGVGARLETLKADMGALPFEPGRFDLLWCEGAIYFLGIGQALDLWRPLLAPGGRIAFTDAVWLAEKPGPDVRAFWSGYPGMTDRAGVRATIAAAGWRLLGEFVLPERAWERYYGPLGARCEALAAEHGADHPVLAEARREIGIWREHGRDYGYAFFVAESG